MESSLEGQTLTVSHLPSTVKLKIPLLGNHQIENAATAYMALKVSGIPITDVRDKKAFLSTIVRARFEIARREPPVIFDLGAQSGFFSQVE